MKQPTADYTRHHHSKEQQMPTNPPTLDELDKLERVIVKGLLAFDERNALIAALVANGYKQADIARRLNAIRAALGAPTITPDAIAATLKRVANKTTPTR
jgi:hypothetical protein